MLSRDSKPWSDPFREFCDSLYIRCMTICLTAEWIRVLLPSAPIRSHYNPRRKMWFFLAVWTCCLFWSTVPHFGSGLIILGSIWIDSDCPGVPFESGGKLYMLPSWFMFYFLTDTPYHHANINAAFPRWLFSVLEWAHRCCLFVN